MSNAAFREQMNMLYTQSWECMFIDMNQAMTLSEQAYALALELNDPVGIAINKFHMSVYHYEKGAVEEALSMTMEALAVFEEHEGHYGEECKCYFGLGNIYWGLGVRDKGIHYYSKAYDIGKAHGIKEIEGRALVFLATSYYDVKEYETALGYFTEASAIYKSLNEPLMDARMSISIGCIYRELGDFPLALQYLHAGTESSAEIQYTMGLARAYNELANTYSMLNENTKALEYYRQSLKLREALDQKQGIITTQLDIAKFYMTKGELDEAVVVIREALALAESIEAKAKQQRAYELLYAIYEAKGETELAFAYFKTYHQLKNEIDHSEAEAKLNNIRLSNKAEQAEKESQFMKVKNRELAEINHKLEETNFALDHEKQRSEQLLLNILPPSIAERLKDGEKLIADSYSQVTVLFADIVGFTQLSSQLTPEALVQFLNRIFLSFDKLAARHKLEKIKTIGDAYMVVSGIPLAVDRPIERMVDMALEMIQEIKSISGQIDHPVGIRVGLHCGSAIAGVIGSSKFSYDIWGDTVNLASRMESNGQSGAIHVTEAIYAALKDRYIFEDRGFIHIKGKGEMQTYFLLSKLGN